MNTNSFVMMKVFSNLVKMFTGLFFFTGKIKYFSNKRGLSKNEKSVVITSFILSPPSHWRTYRIQLSWRGTILGLVWGVRSGWFGSSKLCLEQTEKGNYLVIQRVSSKDASVGQTGLLYLALQSPVWTWGETWKGEGNAMDGMFAPSSYVEAATPPYSMMSLGGRAFGSNSGKMRS